MASAMNLAVSASCSATPIAMDLRNVSESSLRTRTKRSDPRTYLSFGRSAVVAACSAAIAVSNVE